MLNESLEVNLYIETSSLDAWGLFRAAMLHSLNDTKVQAIFNYNFIVITQCILVCRERKTSYCWNLHVSWLEVVFYVCRKVRITRHRWIMSIPSLTYKTYHKDSKWRMYYEQLQLFYRHYPINIGKLYLKYNHLDR